MASRILEAAQELEDFAAGKGGPMILYMPDGRGGMVKREVASIEEYRRVWAEEGCRIIRAAGRDD